MPTEIKPIPEFSDDAIFALLKKIRSNLATGGGPAVKLLSIDYTCRPMSARYRDEVATMGELADMTMIYEVEGGSMLTIKQEYPFGHQKGC